MSSDCYKIADRCVIVEKSSGIMKVRYTDNDAFACLPVILPVILYVACLMISLRAHGVDVLHGSCRALAVRVMVHRGLVRNTRPTHLGYQKWVGVGVPRSSEVSLKWTSIRDLSMLYCIKVADEGSAGRIHLHRRATDSESVVRSKGREACREGERRRKRENACSVLLHPRWLFSVQNTSVRHTVRGSTPDLGKTFRHF